MIDRPLRTSVWMLTAALLGWVATSAHATPAAEGQARETSDAATIGIANDHVSLVFDRRTGALVSLKNLITGGEYLKEPGGDGNPFRAYVDTTEVPPTLKLGFPWAVQPPEGALGGRLVDPVACRLIEAKLHRDAAAKASSLRVVSQHDDTQLVFDVLVTLADGASATDLQLTIRNAGSKPKKVMASVTYFTGLALGTRAEANRGVRLVGFGQSGGAAWEKCGDVYGRSWASQWDAVYDPGSQEVLAVLARDATLRNKIVRRFPGPSPGGGMSMFYFDNHPLQPGGSVTYPVAHVMIYRGDWKHAARTYGKWFRENFKLRRQPDWLDNVDMFVGPWIPHPNAVAAHKAKPDAPDAVTSFAQLPRLYLSAHYDLQEWAQYWQGVIRHNRYDAYQHTDGVYDIRQDLGGDAAFADGVARTERIGRYVGLYVASQHLRNDSIFFQPPYPGAGTDPKDWLLMETPDAELPPPAEPGHQSLHACIRNVAWQDHLAATVAKLMRKTGATYVRIDEFGSNYLVCHNRAHRHKSPYDATPEIFEFLRKIREAMDSVNPDALLFTEGSTDITSLYCNGTLAMWSSGTDIAPVRLVTPEFAGFAYGMGQIECALHGFVTANLDACNAAGWWNPHHGSLWGPGLVNRPRSYPPEGKGLGPKMRWHELGHTFVDAARHGDPTDVNPVGIDQDPDEWASRMWRSEKYWFMVCGNVAGVRPASPVRVRLPELPESVRHAYEFDFETLAMREVPIVRDAQTGIFVEVTHGFSAVFFPKPECPPLVVMDDPHGMKGDEPLELKLTALGPWRTDRTMPRVSVRVAGLNVEPVETELPATVKIAAPASTESGLYYVHVTGDGLRLKRWFRYEAK
jgi:hypothetical protein